MKRSESILMYGVTGILLVILGAAVIFGSEPTDLKAKLTAGAEEAGHTGIFPDLVDPNEKSAEETDPGDDPVESPAGDPEAPDQEQGADQVLVPDVEEPPDEIQVPLTIGHSRVQRTSMGESEVIDHGLMFRYITVRSNDSFDALVEKWTGSVSKREDVIALNEDLQIHPLRPGTRICMPFVEDEDLLLALEARRRERARRPVSEPPVNTVRSRPIPAATSRQVVVKKGESLWVIAEREVGRRKAEAYIKRICTLNGISDPSRVRANQKIKLPPKS